MKNFLKVLAIASALLILCACGNVSAIENETSDSYNTTIPSSTPTDNIYTEQVSVIAPTTSANFENSQIYSEIPSTEAITEPQQPETNQSVPVVSQQITECENQTTQKVYEKTGEMEFSDSGDNIYIKAISSKYGVDAKNLVALYTVPYNDGNIVLQFDGSTDGNGKLIRNESTLIAIYSIDKNLNSKRASEDSSLNEYSYGEMKVMFISTTKYIMPEFQTQLDG